MESPQKNNFQTDRITYRDANHSNIEIIVKPRAANNNDATLMRFCPETPETKAMRVAVAAAAAAAVARGR